MSEEGKEIHKFLIDDDEAMEPKREWYTTCNGDCSEESDESDGGDGLGRDERDGSDSDVSEEEEEALFSACAAGDLTALNQLLESGQSDTSPHSNRTDTNPNCDNMSHLTTCHT